MSTPVELAAVVREMMMVRKGEIVTLELAAERANNIVAFLVMEGIVESGKTTNSQNTSCERYNCSGSTSGLTSEVV